MKYRIVFVFFIITLICKNLYSQYPFPVKEYTDSLASLGDKIINGKSDFVRFEANEKFKNLLVFILSHDKAIEIDFSPVKNLSALAPEDNSFMIFSWVVPRTNQSFESFGILYAYNNRRKVYEIIELKDVKNTVTNAEKKTFRKGEWWGALYYDIITVKSRGRVYHTLIGWDGNNALSTRKVVDILSLSPMAQPTFGASLFSGFGKQQKRVVFEYSANTQMVLRYEKQTYYVEKKKKSKNTQKPPTSKTPHTSDGFKAQQNVDDNIKRKKKSALMIVFDRLVPLNPSLNGVYEFYIPETNIVDGFLYYNDRWNYIPDVDARNPIVPHDKLPQMQKDGHMPVSQRKVKTKIPPVNDN